MSTEDYSTMPKKPILKFETASEGRKRLADTPLDGRNLKKQKMNQYIKLRCCSVLNEMMTCNYAWIFSAPVDPVKWKMPNYSSIITNPMDLGTVRSKLERNMYSNAEEFASDVRLTFNNAMAYNASGHQVHEWAKQLNIRFNQKWNSLKARKNDGAAHQHNLENKCATSTYGSSIWGAHSAESIRDCDVKCSWKPHSSHPCVDSDDHVQMSPERALRAAMLKRRFSDTIFKATHQGNLVDNDVNAPLLVKKMKNDLMLQREKERAAARMALEKMEKTVDINDNFTVMREFEELICHGLSSEDGFAGNSTAKEYSSFDTAAAILDAEEGEIL